MQIMNFDRLARLKCPSCGSDHKDVADIVGTDKRIVAKVTTCCGCGLSNFYANSARTFAGLLIGSMQLAREGMSPEPTEMFERKEMLEIMINPIQTNI